MKVIFSSIIPTNPMIIHTYDFSVFNCFVSHDQFHQPEESTYEEHRVLNKIRFKLLSELYAFYPLKTQDNETELNGIGPTNMYEVMIR